MDAQKHFPKARSLCCLKDSEVEDGDDGHESYLDDPKGIQMHQPVREHMGSVTLGRYSIRPFMQAHGIDREKGQIPKQCENDCIDAMCDETSPNAHIL